jgi:hypothetical protein
VLLKNTQRELFCRQSSGMKLSSHSHRFQILWNGNGS